MPPKKGKNAQKDAPPKVYSEEEVDAFCQKFLKSTKRFKDNLGQRVKRNAAEKDLLKAAEQARDLCFDSMKGDKKHLELILGGTCRNFHILQHARVEVEFSPENAKDERWGMMQKTLDTVQEILSQMGGFRKWVDTTPPSGVDWGAIPEWIGQEEDVEFACTVEGTDPETMYYRVVPALPQGLKIDKLTGMIFGATVEDLEMPQTEFWVIAGNVQGVLKKQIKFGVRAAPPEAVEYDTSKQIAVGGDVFLKPVCRGGRPKKWKVDKELPKGLTIDKKKGIIQGRPMKKCDNQEYMVTGSNLSGTVTGSLQLSVLSAPPVGMNYVGLNGVELAVGVSIYALPEMEMRMPDGTVTRTQSIVSIGDAQAAKTAREQTRAWGRQNSDSNLFQGKKWTKARNQNWEELMSQGMEADIVFKVEPELPKGLFLSTSTGVVFGRPKTDFQRMEFKISANNETGGCEARLNFSANMREPKALMYPDVPVLLHEGDDYAFAPEIDGWVEKWTITPDLPNGLTLDESDGTISGVPIGQAGDGAYTITASNSMGESSAIIKFQIQQGIPKYLIYTPNVTEHCLNVAVELIPRCTSDAAGTVGVSGFGVDPPLPDGLSMDPATGVITGTPQAIQPTSTYTIKCKNEMGSCEMMMAFEILDMPPQDLAYPGVDDHYGTGETINITPQFRGAATKFTVEPALPMGLNLDEKTGIISGHPEALAPDTTYVVSCTNPLGGCTCDLVFEVVAGKPDEVVYPELGAALKVGNGVRFDPVVVPFAQGCTFSVEPALPDGLEFDTETGVITGVPKKGAPKAKFVFKATNQYGTCETMTEFECFQPSDDPMVVDEVFAAKLEEVTNIEEMPEEPDKKARLADWMVWMVHRAFLDDPNLKIFDFSNMPMPPPKEEPRIQPKLARSIRTNTSIVTLLLNSSNFKNSTAIGLAKTLKKNSTLEVLNLETNFVDPDGVKAIANQLKESAGSSAIHTWRFSNQMKGNNMGRPVEEAVAEMLAANNKITKLGFSAQDAHWKNQIDRNLLKNADAARRKRKADKGIPDKVEEVPATNRTFVKLKFIGEPENAAWEIFDDDNQPLIMMRRFMTERRMAPTRDQFQAFCRVNEVTMTYKEAVPLIVGFRKKLLDIMVGAIVEATDEAQHTETGTLKSWKEKNDRMTCEIQTDTRFMFVSTKHIPLGMSDEFADWLEFKE